MGSTISSGDSETCNVYTVVDRISVLLSSESPSRDSLKELVLLLSSKKKLELLQYVKSVHIKLAKATEKQLFFDAFCLTSTSV